MYMKTVVLEKVGLKESQALNGNQGGSDSVRGEGGYAYNCGADSIVHGKINGVDKLPLSPGKDRAAVVLRLKCFGYGKIRQVQAFFRCAAGQENEKTYENEPSLHFLLNTAAGMS